MIVHCAHKQMVKLKELKPHPKNRNKHPAEQIDRLARVLEYQGVRYPIKVSNLSGFITSGHGRLMAAKKLGWKEFPVDYQDYESEEQEYADLQADNAIALWAELDLSGINSDLGDIGPDFDIDLLGIKNFTIDVAEKEGLTDPDEVSEPPKEPKTKRGDIYRLGNHRLMCGDSTMIDDVEKLMDGDKADLFLSDPPYGVSYTDKNEYLNSLGKPMACPKAIENDHKTPEQMKVFWDLCFTNACVSLKDKSSYYIFAPQGGDLLLLLLQSVRQSGFQLKHVLIWAKNNHVLGRCDYHYKHEPIVYGWKQKGTHEFYGAGQKKTSVWDFPKPLKNDLHPTMKPIEVLEEALLNSTKAQDIVLDLFGGSGSTLIASEKQGRSCRMIEIDPGYCDVIVERWEKFTGNKAELIS